MADNKKAEVNEDLEFKGQSGPDLKLLRGYGNGSLIPYPPWWDVDEVVFPVHISNPEHWLVMVMDLRTLEVVGYDSLMDCGNHNERLKYVEVLGDCLPGYLDAIGYWKYCDWLTPGRRRPEINLSYVRAEEVPQQSGKLGDCGVWTCINMEKLAFQRDVRLPNASEEEIERIAMEQRLRMIHLFFNSRTHWEPPSPPREKDLDVNPDV